MTQTHEAENPGGNESNDEVLQKVAQLRAEIAKKEQDLAQCNEASGCYSREFLYDVRDLDKLVALSPSPSTLDDLRKDGPARRQKIAPNYEETEETDDVKRRRLIVQVHSLFKRFTPKTADMLTNEFLALNVPQSPALKDVVSIIFEKVVEKPGSCEIYSKLCNKQVAEEYVKNIGVSLFRDALLVRCQESFTTKITDDFVKEKESEIEAEMDEEKKKEKQYLLLKTITSIRNEKFGNVKFIGHLFLEVLASIRIIHYCVVDLLKSIAVNPENLDGNKPDEEAIECAVILLKTVGKRVQEDNDAKAAGMNPLFPLELTFETLQSAMPVVGNRLRDMIADLIELRENGWVPKKSHTSSAKCMEDKENEQLQKANSQRDTDVSIELQKAAKENAHLRRVVAAMDISMKAMRSEMVCLKKQNEALLELVRSRKE